MKHLGISGGGTKIGGLFGAAEVLLLEKEYRPDLISGISAGAILSLPLALGKFDQVRAWVRDFTLCDFFSSPPITGKGKISIPAILNVIFRKPYLGRQENLPRSISKVVTRQDFEVFREGGYPECVVGTVDFITGGRIYYNLRELDYDGYLMAVNASASLPVFTRGIRLHGKYLYDGGVRDHIGTARMLESYPEITETVSIFSRPSDYQVLPEEFSERNILRILERYVDITNTEVSKNDEWMEDVLCRDRQIKQTKIFLPRIMDSVYDVNPEHLERMYQAGRQAAIDALG